ncbi:hypothetical protein EJ02DRAFT_428835 [Clathrospora elynae]|uniref:C2H2-type domain-containing protein n=1 Tax=Clathrospora elynae TaxID=706981 RepID=A0A6A5S5I1_9PLEO|nr:hypothetical protein EJ02DRAFT_428835 [Clathrospora elynae]
MPGVLLPAAQQPATKPPATNLPATQQPAAQLPASQLPATQLPAAQLPATQLPTTQPPTAQGSSILQSLEAAKETIIYLSNYNVLVCKEHATAIQNLDAHLRSHHIVAGKLQKEIVESYQDEWIRNPQDVTLPSPLGPPIQELGAPLEGFQCEEEDCHWITINIDKLQKHCKSKHGLSWRGNKRALTQKVMVQTFFRKRGLRRYFLVNTANCNPETSVPQEVAAVVGKQLADWKATQQIHNEEAQVMDAEAAKTDKTGWFKRTGWLEHLANRNLVHLAHQARLPDQSETKLQHAAKLVELLVERSVTGLSTLAQETRRWLRSAKQNKVDPRPMARLQNPESQAVYASYFVKFVCYFLRTFAEYWWWVVRVRWFGSKARRGQGTSKWLQRTSACQNTATK